MHSYSAGRYAIALLTLLFTHTPLQAEQVYKYTTPDGKVMYSDKRPKGTNDWQLVDVPKPPSEAERAQAQNRADEEARKRNAFRERADLRRQRLDDADKKLTSARKALDDAEKALEAGRAPQPGDRVGVAGTGSRLSEEYFRRIAELEARVETAKKDLTVAQRERNDAR